MKQEREEGETIERNRREGFYQEGSRSRSRSRDKPDLKTESEPTKCLAIEQQMDSQSVQLVFDDLSIGAGTSLPDEVETRNNLTLIKYPSIEACSKVFMYTQGSVVIDRKGYKVDYYPRKETLANQDWMCNKCNYSNYSRRNKCNRCENIRNTECRPVFGGSSSAKNEIPKNRDEINPCSLMIRGPVIGQVDEAVLIDIFQHFCPIKDVRTIRNRLTGVAKDFAFIQFFTEEDAAEVYKQANTPNFRIENQPVSCLYSKNRKEEFSQFRDQYVHQRAPRAPLTQNYCEMKREQEIREEKEREVITIQQLKEKKELESKRLHQNALQKELSSDQIRRKQAQQEMKKWEKARKVQPGKTEVMFICPLCVRKFQDEEELKNHEEKSLLHKRMYDLLVL